MGSSDFYKGDKKKKKKGQQQSSLGFAPVFTPPTIIGKGKRPEEK